MTIPVQIDGIGTIQTAAEYTNNHVQTEYNSFVNAIIAQLNYTGTFTSANAINYNQALQSLLNLAQNAVNPPITYQMANAIQGLATITKAVNPTGFLDTSSAHDIIAIKNLLGQGLDGILNTAQVAGSQVAVSTLQSFIQVNYIDTGNTLLNSALTELQEAMEANRNAMTLLGSLQQLKNGVLVGPLGSIAHNSIGNPISFIKLQTIKYTQASLWGAGRALSFTRTSQQANSIPKVYINTAGPELSHRILVNITGSSSIVNNIQAAGQGLILQLQKMIPTLLQLSPPTNPPDGTTLGEQLQTIMNGMIGDGGSDNIVKWVLDNYNDQNTLLPDGTTLQSTAFNVAHSGNFQRDLTSAITTAQATNFALNNQLGKTLFVFNEFYRSASQVLKQVHTMIVEMAANSRRT